MHPCKDCRFGFYEPTGPEGELACNACGRPIYACEAEPEVHMTEHFWQTVARTMEADGCSAVEHACSGNEEQARYFARSAAHNALLLEEYHRSQKALPLSVE